MKLEEIVNLQKDFFNSDISKSIAFRKNNLLKLRDLIKANEKSILEALYKDLGKSKAEAYMTEVSMVYDEIKIMLKNIDKWSKPKKVVPSILNLGEKNRIYYEPYGLVLIISPWNYPFTLSLMPLITSIASGNTAILKLSRFSVNTSELLRNLINNSFPKEYIYILDDNISYEDLWAQRYDMIFFTGSTRVGKEVMKVASNNLTPVILELGGKSPCIIDKSANLDIAARRIVWAKLLNAGQTCIAPDYFLVHKSIKDEFVKRLQIEIEKSYKNPLENETYPKIISEKHFDRIIDLLSSATNVLGGKSSKSNLKIEPAILSDVKWTDKIMEEELFAPIFPIITYDNVDEIINKIKDLEKPLALYLYTEDKIVEKKIISSISFGGGCINDSLMHISKHNMPFGGVGNSGLGMYHGKYGFESFSHKKSIVKSTTLFDIKARYAPFTKFKFKLFKFLLK